MTDKPFVIVRAADGHLACKIIREGEEKPKSLQEQTEEHWMSITNKKALDKYAKEKGIELDRRKSLEAMREELSKALAAPPTEPETQGIDGEEDKDPIDEALGE